MRTILFIATVLLSFVFAVLSTAYAFYWSGFSSGQQSVVPPSVFGGPVLTVLPFNWDEHTELYPRIYCRGGTDGPWLNDWGLKCTVELENFNGVIASSSEWLSPEAVSDALNSNPQILATSTIEDSNVCTGMMVDEVLCGQYLRKTGYSCFNLPLPLCDKNSGISCLYQNMNAPNIGNCLTAKEGYEKDYPQQ